MPTIARVAVETISPRRRALLSTVAKTDGLQFGELVKRFGSTAGFKVSDQTVRREVDDLVVLNLLDDSEAATYGEHIIARGKDWPTLAPLVNELRERGR